MKRVLKIILNIILDLLIGIIILFLILAIYNYIQVKVMNNKYVNYFGYTYFETVSGSMKDTININDYILVKITDDVKEDDIVSFISDDMIVTHRIIKIDDDEIVTKGDANNTIDNPIEKEQIIGKVIFIGKKVGVIVKTITEPVVFISFFVTILLFSLVFSDNKEGRSTGYEKKICEQKEN